jgi:outer membrane biosynthesis protein TonB
MIKSLLLFFYTLFTLAICAANAQSYVHYVTDSCKDRPVKHRKFDSSRLISFGVINGRAIKLVKPDYPPTASSTSISGSVEIRVIIDKYGCVEQAAPLSGNPLLIPASLKAARASIFEPVYLGRNKIRVLGIIIYHYIL